jgi:hypothetical protein
MLTIADVKFSAHLTFAFEWAAFHLVDTAFAVFVGAVSICHVMCYVVPMLFLNGCP